MCQNFIFWFAKTVSEIQPSHNTSVLPGPARTKRYFRKSTENSQTELLTCINSEVANDLETKRTQGRPASYLTTPGQKEKAGSKSSVRPMTLVPALDAALTRHLPPRLPRPVPKVLSRHGPRYSSRHLPPRLPLPCVAGVAAAETAGLGVGSAAELTPGLVAGVAAGLATFLSAAPLATKCRGNCGDPCSGHSHEQVSAE